jgi:hypothetical protein
VLNIGVLPGNLQRAQEQYEPLLLSGTQRVLFSSISGVIDFSVNLIPSLKLRIP